MFIAIFSPIEMAPIKTTIRLYSIFESFGAQTQELKKSTEINYSLGAGSLIRPILNYLLLFFMCYLILGKYTNINLPYIGKLNEK